MKEMKYVAILVLCLLALSAVNVSAATFYNCSLKNITQSVDGETIIIFGPAEGETRFIDDARISIDPYSEGSKGMMAVALTAASMNKDIVVRLNDEPSYDIIEPASKISLSLE